MRRIFPIQYIAYQIFTRNRTQFIQKPQPTNPDFIYPIFCVFWLLAIFVYYTLCAHQKHLFLFELMCRHKPPPLFLLKRCVSHIFSVLDAVFGMTLEFGSPPCHFGHCGGGLCRLMNVGIIRARLHSAVCILIYIYIPNLYI